MQNQEEGKLKESQIEAMQNRNGIDDWPFPQPRGWVAQWDPEGLAHAIKKNESLLDIQSSDTCEDSSK